ACCVWATLLKPDVARSGKGNSPVPCTAWADQKWSTIPRSYLVVQDSLQSLLLKRFITVRHEIFDV
ncbi:hypothetical protein, partial [Sodalis sp. (in: enterobacteria)]|uniref:hypothetical protein n=1 Tax=Sodalis sp. (in: enterobacteria) TaxID=1898979 RepID=UPI003F68634D